MSNKAITWAYTHKTGRGAGCKAVLVALADMADEAGSCYPGQELLGELTEQDTRSVRTQIAHLMSLGLVRKEPRFRTDGKRTSDRYVLALEVSVDELDLPTTGRKHQRKNQPVVESTGGNDVPSPPATVSLTTGNDARVTIREPSVEPQGGAATAAAPPDEVKARRGARLSEDWVRSVADREWQQREDIPEDFARHATMRFKNHFLAATGRNSTKLDWSKAWQNWVSNDWGGHLGATYRREHKLESESELQKSQRARARRW